MKERRIPPKNEENPPLAPEVLGELEEEEEEFVEGWAGLAATAVDKGLNPLFSPAVEENVEFEPVGGVVNPA